MSTKNWLSARLAWRRLSPDPLALDRLAPRQDHVVGRTGIGAGAAPGRRGVGGPGAPDRAAVLVACLKGGHQATTLGRTIRPPRGRGISSSGTLPPPRRRARRPGTGSACRRGCAGAGSPRSGSAHGSSVRFAAQPFGDLVHGHVAGLGGAHGALRSLAFGCESLSRARSHVGVPRPVGAGLRARQRRGRGAASMRGAWSSIKALEKLWSHVTKTKWYTCR